MEKYLLATVEITRNSKINRIFAKRSSWYTIKIVSFGDRTSMIALREKYLKSYPQRRNTLRVVSHSMMKKYYDDIRTKAYDYTLSPTDAIDWRIPTNENNRIETWRYSK